MENILIVEDHKEFREAMKRFILMKGVKADILEAVTGQEGIDIALRRRPKVVIIDIHLTRGISGLELASLIKRQDDSCGIIILTMYAKQDMKDLGRHKDVEDFIDKSDLDRRLVPTINRLLSPKGNL
ncbi:MAG: response regulator [Candidatus Omnitrophica bacterium]|nr:response regulator [Candidatus Omnitrophota bacterium]MDE2008668.1 response regulator [Candidatus Omnitrophota bacterium]MDE2230888.1 response regulator [Candidatus Omnitrophota bacterium]